MSRQHIWMWARVVGGGAILAVLVWQVGAGPFVDGLRQTTGWAIAAALAITLVTTVCCAWRWRLIAGGLGIDVPLPAAVGAYYRSQFLNSTLPGGVLGDVHRGVVTGRAAGELGRGLRSVVYERVSGQVVQVILTAAVLLLVPSPIPVTWLLVVVAAVGLVVVCVKSREMRESVLSPRIWPGVVLTSAVALAGHVGVFAVAVHAAGTHMPVSRLLALALVVLLASAIPLNVAGWGPREGAAAWAFSTIGSTAAEGVTVAVVYGVLALVATLPGGVLLVARQRVTYA